MKRRILMICGIIASAGVVSGCASVPVRGGFTDVQEMVGARTQMRVYWYQGGPEDAAVKETIHAMLEEPLTVDAGVQIALLNNRALQATFEELGIAQADLVQAGLLHNPVIAGTGKFPHTSGLGTNLEFSVAQNFLDLLLMPLRKKLASEQFEQAKLRVSDAVLRLSAEVKSAYYTVQGAEQVHAMRQTVLQAAEAAAELAERQRTAGTINELELANERGAFQQTKLDVAKSQVEIQLALEALTRLMGLWGKDAHWSVVEGLRPLPKREVSIEKLEMLAVAQRLDLAAARKGVAALQRGLTLARFGVISSVDVGVEAEHDLDHSWVTGPSLELEVPIFDQGQPARARARAALRQGQHRLAALETDIRSEVRMKRTRLLAARHLAASYRDNLIPIREQIVVQTQKHYNFMLVGTFQLLQAKRDEVEAYREYSESLREYWIAYSELERAVGGQLAVAELEPSPILPTQPSVETPHRHHHGGDQDE